MISDCDILGRKMDVTWVVFLEAEHEAEFLVQGI